MSSTSNLFEFNKAVGFQKAGDDLAKGTCTPVKAAIAACKKKYGSCDVPTPAPTGRKSIPLDELLGLPKEAIYG